MSKTRLQILSISTLALVMTGCSNQPQDLSESTLGFDLISDVKTICTEVSKKYAYFEARSTYWKQTCENAKHDATLLDDANGALAIFEQMIDDLYDPHISLNTNNQNSPRLVPSGSDLWFEKNKENYIVSAVRPLSGAAKAGIMTGDQLVSFNGLPPKDLALTRMHSARSAISKDRILWAINAAVAGTRTNPRNIKIRRGKDVLSFVMGVPEVPPSNESITYKTISEDIGYIRFNNSLGNAATIVAFDRALNALRKTNSLIIDLRETPGGGNTDVAEPIMGRFIKKRTAYQRTVLRNGSAKDRKVKPSGSWTYDKPLIVLVGRWTGSMGEGMAIGFDGMGRGKVMGSSMAGLAGGTEAIRLKETGIYIKFPTYDLHHLNGTPRHKWKPSKILTADNGAEEDTLLQSAILELDS